jgi:hypothetical protein
MSYFWGKWEDLEDLINSILNMLKHIDGHSRIYGNI